MMDIEWDMAQDDESETATKLARVRELVAQIIEMELEEEEQD